MFKESVLSHLNITLSDKQLKQFELYYDFLVEYNKHTNLTRITEEKEVYFKHFLDSLLLSKSIDINSIKTICDMGSGAGFPSIPLKIIFPHLVVTIVDSLNKRITFLQKLTQLLSLSDIILVHDRAEVYAISHQETFDLVTARALGNLALISEMGLPMVKVNGYLVALKSAKYQEELEQANEIIAKLKAKVIKIDQISLPFDYGFRVNIVIKKMQHVSGYPRSYAQMIKKKD